MPRNSRVVVPHLPHHVVQRGHNRDIVFTEEADYQYYLSNLASFKERFGVRLYAYCLMNNHVHLLLSPIDKTGLSQLMKHLAGRQTRYKNRRKSTCGTLWQGRYKSSVVERDQYLFTCIRYIELNPVRAGITACPSGYRWSSFGDRMDSSSVIDPVPGLERVVTDARRYRDYIFSGVSDGEMKLIRESVGRCQVTGSSRFIDKISAEVGKRIENRGPGRPPKCATSGVSAADN